MAIKLVVFDWDGTLMDSLHRITDSMQFSARQMGLPEPTHDEVKHIVGLSLDNAFLHLFGEHISHLYDDLRTHYRQHYVEGSKVETPFYPGVTSMLRSLHATGTLLGVATGKSRAGLNRVAEKMSVSQLFHTSRCSDECESKPHPQMLLQIMNEVGVRPEETLMVGDTSYDILMVCQAGVSSIGVCYGAHEQNMLVDAGASECFQCVASLASWLERRISENIISEQTDLSEQRER